MEIPNELPKRGPARKKEIPNPIEAALAASMGELIGAQGQINAIHYLQGLHLNSEEMRSPFDGPSHEDSEPSAIEQFFGSDHPSHLTRVSKLESQIALSRRNVSLLDETDNSGKSLYDFIPPEIQGELEDQLEGLQDKGEIRKTIEADLKGFCGDIWQDYKASKASTEAIRLETFQNLMAGPDASEKEKEAINASKNNIFETETLGELLGLEKARIAITALLANQKEKPERMAQASDILGVEFDLIQAQVEHINQVLTKDWLSSDPDTGIIKPTSGKDLISPEILRRMDDNEPSQEQIDALEKAYGYLASRKTNDTESPRDRLNSTIAIVLATNEILQLGTKAKVANILKDVREISKAEKDMEQTPEQTEELVKKKSRVMDFLSRRLPSGLREKSKELAKGIWQDKIKPGVGRIVQQWPQMLFLGVMSKVWKGHFDQDGNRHGSQERFMAYINGEAQMGAIFQPL